MEKVIIYDIIAQCVKESLIEYLISFNRHLIVTL